MKPLTATIRPNRYRLQLQRADDLGLPPRTVVIRRDYFSPEERELYLSLFSDAKRQFSTYLDQGTVLNSKLLNQTFSMYSMNFISCIDYYNIFSLSVSASFERLAAHYFLVLLG